MYSKASIREQDLCHGEAPQQIQLKYIEVTAAYANFVGDGKLDKGYNKFKNHPTFNVYVNFCHNS